MTRSSFVVTTVLLSCVLTPGCKKQEPLSADIECTIDVKDLGVVGATVLVQGQRGVFTRVPWGNGQEIAAAKVKVPRTGPSLASDLKLELQTPCGAKVIPLKAEISPEYETIERGSPGGMLTTVATMEGTVPASIAVWIDGKDKKIGVGKGTLTAPADASLPGEGSVSLFDAACQASWPVTVDGVEVGKVVASQLQNKALFISAKKGACYHYELVAYGDTPSSGPEVLKSSQIHILQQPRIDYFLGKAPEKRSVAAGQHSDYVYELYETPCP